MTAGRSRPRVRRRRWARLLAFLALSSLSLAIIPRLWMGLGADSLYEGDADVQRALADDLVDYIDGRATAIDLGDRRFDGEWTLVGNMMAIVGLGQVVQEHPELRSRYLPAMRLAARRMMRPEQRAFATRAWGSDGLRHLRSGRGEAWLGWPNLALSMLTRVDPGNSHAAMNRRITEALARRLAHAPHAVIRTYPRQSFPTDVAACAASIALYDRATGADHSELLGRWARDFERLYVDPESGYLWQQANWRTGTGRDAPRGSGTAVTAYFLSFVDAELSAKLTDALAAHEHRLLGFGAEREYPDGYSGWGDVDSGPVLAGVSIAATGFTLGAARANARRELFTRTLRTTRLFGLSTSRGRSRRFAAGGFFGNAVLLAQLTAQPATPRRSASEDGP